MTTLSDILPIAAGSALILVTSWILAELFSNLISAAARRAGAKPDIVHHARLGVRAVALGLGVVGVAEFSGIATGFTTLTISGIAGIALSLALQNSLSNVISGILLLYDGTVRVNDMVQIGLVKGQVVDIFLRNTVIKTEDGQFATVGNATLSSGPIINYSATARLTS